MLVRRSIVMLALALAGCGGAARVGGAPNDAHVLTMLNPIGDRQEATVYAEEVARLSKGALRIRHRAVAAQGQRRLRGRGDRRRPARARRPRMGGQPRVEGQPARAQRAAADRQLRARAARGRGRDSSQRMLDELRPLGLVGIGVLPGPLRRPVGMRRGWSRPATSAGVAIGQQQSAWRTRRCARSAHGRSRSRSRGRARARRRRDQHVGARSRTLRRPGRALSANVDLWPRPLVVFANADSARRADGRRARRPASGRRVGGAAPGGAEPRERRRDRGQPLPPRPHHVRHRERGRSAVPARRRRAGLPRPRADPATRAAIDAIAALKREVAAPPDTLPACERSTAPEARPARRSTGRGGWTPGAAPPRRSTSTRTGVTGSSSSTAGASPSRRRTDVLHLGVRTYTVDGDRTTWRFTDGGGQAPNGAVNKPGEEFSYSLSVYRDTVTLGPVKGAISPSTSTPSRGGGSALRHERG